MLQSLVLKKEHTYRCLYWNCRREYVTEFSDLNGEVGQYVITLYGKIMIELFMWEGNTGKSSHKNLQVRRDCVLCLSDGISYSGVRMKYLLWNGIVNRGYT